MAIYNTKGCDTTSYISPQGKRDTSSQDRFHSGLEDRNSDLGSRGRINNLAPIYLFGLSPFSVFLKKKKKKTICLNRLKSTKSLVQIEETFRIHLLQKMTKTFYEEVSLVIPLCVIYFTPLGSSLVTEV